MGRDGDVKVANRERELMAMSGQTEPERPSVVGEPPASSRDVALVGAGVGGLTAGALLAAAGTAGKRAWAESCRCRGLPAVVGEAVTAAT